MRNVGIQNSPEGTQKVHIFCRRPRFGTAPNADSHLLVDKIRVNRDLDSDSYSVVRSDPSGLLDTVVYNPDA